MRDGQLDKMSLKDLTSLDSKVQAAIDEKRVSERGEMRAKMEEMARASGFSVAELFGRKGKGGKGMAKYRNPKDHTQTWTGRGRRPLWMSRPVAITSVSLSVNKPVAGEHRTPLRRGFVFLEVQQAGPRRAGIRFRGTAGGNEVYDPACRSRLRQPSLATRNLRSISSAIQTLNHHLKNPWPTGCSVRLIGLASTSRPQPLGSPPAVHFCH